MSESEHGNRTSGRDTMVGWSASYSPEHQPGTMHLTQIFDATPKGAFLKSGRQIEVGGRVLLHTELWGMRLSVPAVVRWVGTSQVHQCAGFGVEFDYPVSLFRAIVPVP